MREKKLSPYKYIYMATTPTHTPPHTFTSTLENRQYKSDFNVWIVILTAVFFFLVLSIYNFFIAIYNYIIGNNPNNIKNYNKINYFNVFATFGFMLIWFIIAISLYLLFNGFCLLGSAKSLDTHPLLKDETKSVSGELKII
jgi:hypothetical protein